VPETKIKTMVNNVPMEAFDVPVIQSNEIWSEYKLEDGTTLRIKFAVGSIMRLAGEYDPENNPIYIVKGTVLTVPLIVPESLQKKG
jgi:hypothetical protein